MCDTEPSVLADRSSTLRGRTNCVQQELSSLPPRFPHVETTNLVAALGPVNRDNNVFITRCFPMSLASPTASGDEGARTLNPRLAKPVLSQLSYIPRGLKNKSQAPNHKPSLSFDACLLGFNQSGRARSRIWDLVVISDAL